MLGWLKRIVGMKPSQRETEINRLRGELAHAEHNIRKIKAGYDAAAVTAETLGLWSKADDLSAKWANSGYIRKNLRVRSRHEAANGSHCRGITLTLANDLVGTGPQLQVGLKDEAVNEQIEVAWNAWANEILFDEKVHTFSLATVIDGEGLAQAITNRDLESPVKLDIQVLECDIMATPWQRMLTSAFAVDGMELDAMGKPKIYHLLKFHPGDVGYVHTQEYDPIPARNIFHYFRQDRPQQYRGIPELTPALLIFGHLREYSAAVLQAARVAACLSALIHTKAKPDGSPLLQSYAFSATDMEPGMLVGLPDQYDVTQLKPEQPATTYDAYERRKLGEACHCCLLPYSVGTGDFSQESYSGGRMSRQVYHSGVSVRRHHLNQRFLDRVFNAWVSEAARVGVVPYDLGKTPTSVPRQWWYDPWEHIDETKAADAITTNLANNTTTLAAECAKRKMDWRKVVRQRGIERALLAESGTPEESDAPAMAKRKAERELDARQAEQGRAA